MDERGLRDGYCQPITIKDLIPSLFTILQASLLHPHFHQSQSLRFIRLLLTPLNVIWWIGLPYVRCFRPMEEFVILNLGLGSISFTMAIKSIEWGLSHQAYYQRTWVIEPDGIRRWKKVKDGSDELEKRLQENQDLNLFKLITWTLLLITSSVHHSLA